MSQIDKKFDDLTVLTHMGKKREAFIREALNIQTYQDLARLSTNKIITAFRKAGKTVPETHVQTWISEAQALSKRQLTETEDGEWEWLNKIFIVSFRVTKAREQLLKREISVHHMKVDKKGNWIENGEMIPIPVTGKELYPWMVDQLGESIDDWDHREEPLLDFTQDVDEPGQPLPTVKTPSSTRLSPSTKVPSDQIKITQLRAFSPLDNQHSLGIGRVGYPFEGFVKDGKPFALEVSFELPDLQIEGNEDVAFRAKLYVCSSSDKISLGDTKVDYLKPMERVYQAQLPKVVLKAGTYRLGVLVYIRTHPPIVNYLEIPHFQVR